MNSPAVPGPAVPDRGHLRASDADRERVAEVLRTAAGDGRLTLEELDERLDTVYQAKTYAELEPVTRDLPQHGHVAAPAAAQAADPRRFGGTPGGPPVAVAIMSGFSRRGDWVVPRDLTCVAIMGGGELDMRDARFEEPTVRINVFALMGGIEITVPEDAHVRVHGIGVMGGFDHPGSGEGQASGPTIIINGLALMGGVDVRRKPPKMARREKLERGARELE
jgi:hypothetical protein